MSDSIEMKDIIRERREELGLTQTQLAHALGTVCSEFICMVEHGRRSFALDNIPRLANVLWLDTDGLCRCALFEAAPKFYSAAFGGEVPARPKPTVNP
jgi:transcriptional regulator with XRE-family HTH domain